MSLQVTDAADDTLTQQVKGTSGAAHVVDVAIHPGEDSTFDRTWGGPRAAGKAGLTGSGAVGAAGARMYYGFIVTTALSAAAITIYDNTAGSGTVVDVIPASTGAGTRSVLPCPVPCTTGIYASFAGTGTVLFLYA